MSTERQKLLEPLHFPYINNIRLYKSLTKAKPSHKHLYIPFKMYKRCSKNLSLMITFHPGKGNGPTPFQAHTCFLYDSIISTKTSKWFLDKQDSIKQL